MVSALPFHGIRVNSITKVSMDMLEVCNKSPRCIADDEQLKFRLGILGIYSLCKIGDCSVRYQSTRYLYSVDSSSTYFDACLSYSRRPVLRYLHVGILTGLLDKL